jgi:hypothetical protein
MGLIACKVSARLIQHERIMDFGNWEQGAMEVKKRVRSFCLAGVIASDKAGYGD